jgi:hypothetical protein
MKYSSTFWLCCFFAAGTLYANDKSFSKLNTGVFPYNFNVDGNATLPQIFFFNTDKGDYTYLRPQVEMAVKAGVHIYSFPLSVPMKYPTDEPNFAHAAHLLERFIAIDPQAKFLVRLVLGPIDRNIANVLSHGAGIWWMDLGASGMFNSQDVWDLIDQRQRFFRKSTEAGKSYSANVQLIVDEESKTYLADDYSFDRSVLHNVLSALNRSSATVESYLFSDYVSGKTPTADLVVFANTFKMSAEQMTAVQTRLARDRSHRAWCFLPGYIDADGNYDTANVEELTGFAVYLRPGKVGTRGIYGNFEGVTWNAVANNLDLEERPVVGGEGCTVIGQYTSDGLPSCAMKLSNGIYSFYLGSPGANAELFRRILKTAGVHMWTDQRAVVTRNNKYLFVYTGNEDELTLNVPEGIQLKTTRGEAVRTIANRVSLSMDKTGVQWFEYTE